MKRPRRRFASRRARRKLNFPCSNPAPRPHSANLESANCNKKCWCHFFREFPPASSTKDFKGVRSRIPGWVDPLGLSSVPPRKVLVMNAGFNHHFSLECLEEYAMDMLSEEDCTFL